MTLIGAASLPATGSAFSASQARYLRAANTGVKQTNRWWNRGRHWYSSVLGGSNVASLWGIVPLFEALNGLAIATPSHRHLRALNRFARGAERYLNPSLEPVPGFGPKPGQREPGKTTWFDDNGWWGLAFLDAYRATANPRYLFDAEIAQQFISVSGWDTTPGRPGGIWWNTNHSFYAGESLAGGTLLSAPAGGGDRRVAGGGAELVGQRGERPVLERLDGARRAAGQGGDGLQRQVGHEAERDDLALVIGELPEGPRQIRIEQIDAAGEQSSGMGPPSTAGRRNERRRASTRRWWAMVNTQRRRAASSPRNRGRSRTTWRKTSPSRSSGSAVRWARR